MTYQKITIPLDHGNRNMKTAEEVFTSGLVESDLKPVLGEYLQYNGKYYSLTGERIPYMRDKTLDDRFFIRYFAQCRKAVYLNYKDLQRGKYVVHYKRSKKCNSATVCT